MDEMIRWASKEHGIDVYRIKDGNFKIALVGGFGNYYLVRQQMHEKFRFSNRDDKEKGIIRALRGLQKILCLLCGGIS